VVGVPCVAGREFLRATAACHSLAPPEFTAAEKHSDEVALETTMDDGAADVIAIIAKRLPAEKRNLDMAGRLQDLGIDSFSAVEMIFDLEEKFDVQISYNSNDTRLDLETVGDVIGAIKNLVAERS